MLHSCTISGGCIIHLDILQVVLPWTAMCLLFTLLNVCAWIRLYRQHNLLYKSIKVRAKISLVYKTSYSEQRMKISKPCFLLVFYTQRWICNLARWNASCYKCYPHLAVCIPWVPKLMFSTCIWLPPLDIFKKRLEFEEDVYDAGRLIVSLF